MKIKTPCYKGAFSFKCLLRVSVFSLSLLLIASPVFAQLQPVKWQPGCSTVIQQNKITRSKAHSSLDKFDCGIYSKNFIFSSGGHLEYTVDVTDGLLAFSRKGFGLVSANGDKFILYILSGSLKIGNSLQHKGLETVGAAVAVGQKLQIKVNGTYAEFYQGTTLIGSIPHQFKPPYQAIALLDIGNAFTGLAGDFTDCYEVPPGISVEGQTGPNFRTCQNSPVTVTASGYDEYWIENMATPPFTTPVFDNSYTLKPAATTTYQLIGRRNTCPDVTVRTTFTITVDPAFSVNIQGPEQVCETQQNIMLNIVPTGGSGSISYIWATVPAGFDPDLACDNCQQTEVFPDDDKTYYATAITQYGCRASANHTIKVDPMPSLSCPSPLVYCTNQPALVLKCVPSNATYQKWTPSTGLDNTVSPRFASPPSTTNYTVTLKNGLCTKTENVTITVYEGPTADFVHSTTTGLEVNFNAQIGGGPSSGFSWSFGDNTTSTTNPVNHLYAAAGSYWVTLSVTSPNCPATKHKKRVIVKQDPNCCNN